MNAPLIAISGGNMASGLAAIRDVGRAGLRVVGAVPVQRALNWHSRWSSNYLRLPPPGYPARLVELLDQAKVDAILPMESSYVGALSRHAATSGMKVQLAVPPLDAFLCAYDNRRTIEHCQQLRIGVPRLMCPEDAKGPVVVKPREDVGAARGVYFCRNGVELGRALIGCRDFGEPIVQEFVPGGTQAMRTLTVLFDRRSRLVAYFTTRKLEQFPVSGGVTAMSISTDDGALVELMLPFFESLGWCGPAEVELKIDERDGVPKVIEVNPRLPGYVVFPVECGLHLPLLAARVALGESPSASGYTVGRRYVQPVLVLKALREARQAHLLTSARLLRDCSALMTAPWVRWDDVIDPLPRLARAFSQASGKDGGLATEHGLRLAELEGTTTVAAMPPSEPTEDEAEVA